VHRFAGRVAVAGGASLVVAWTMLPEDRARAASVLITLTLMVLLLGRKLASVASYALRLETPAGRR